MRPDSILRMQEFFKSSLLDVGPAEFWKHATSPSGINRELSPFLRMTFPEGTESFLENWKSGERLFRSWILLFGVLPVEYDDVAVEELEPGRRFLERSALLSQRLWEHERVIEGVEQGTRVTDRIRFIPRIKFLTLGHRAVFRAVFWWRHRNLRRLFGAVDGKQGNAPDAAGPVKI